PRIDAPKAGPSLTTAWRRADPTPLRSADSSTRAAEAAVANTKPAPNPATNVQAAMNPSPLVALRLDPTTRPMATSAKPAPTVILAPRRAATRSAVTAPPSSPTMTGSSRNPEPCGSRPTIAWKYWGKVNRAPNSPNTPNAMRITPQVKLRERNSDRSTSGWPPGWALRRRSHSPNATRARRPAAAGTIALALPQPLAPAWTTPYIRATRPPLERSTPTKSMLGRLAERDSGTSATTAIRPSSATGTFIRKIQPHHTFVSIQPPMIGPRGRPTKFAAPQIPTARGRSASSNSTVRMDSARTMMAAPASP